jgi:hypothetical protein
VPCHCWLCFYQVFLLLSETHFWNAKRYSSTNPTSLSFLCFTREVTKEKRLKPLALVLLFNILVIPWAMENPLLFVSATLFLHNWVAFFAWTLQAKTRQDKNVAIVSTLVFALFNILIFMGLLDSFFPEVIQDKFLHANIEATTWILSPWTDNIIIGQRALCLYTLGLPLHYFIWLKAIPECNHISQTPPSFRASLKKLDAEVGRGPLMTFIALFLVLLTIWLYSFALGSYIYFLLAGLHFWIELIGLALINIKKNSP